SEDRQIGLHDVEELDHDSRNSREVTRPTLAFQRHGDLADDDFRARIWRIHRFDRRQEENIDAFSFERLAIALFIPRIFFEFFDGSSGDQFTFGIGTTTASPYSFFSSSVLLMWNDSAVPSGKRPLRTSSRYFVIAVRMSSPTFA